MSKIEKVDSHSLGLGNVVKFADDGPYYIITGKKSVKTGKHGSAKVLIKVTSLLDGKKNEFTISGSTTIDKATSTKQVLIFFHGSDDEIYVAPLGDQNNIHSLDINDTSTSNVDKLVSTSKELQEGRTLQFVKVQYPGFSYFTDINIK